MTDFAAAPLELTHQQIDDASHGHEAPLLRVTLPQTTTPVWLATRYDVVKAVLADPRFVRDLAEVPGQDGGGLGAELLDEAGLPPEYRLYLEILVMVDGPDHARLRTHVMRAFAPRRIAALRPRIQRVVRELSDELAATGAEFEFLTGFAYPVVTEVICDIIGVDEADRGKVAGWMRDYESGEPDRFLPGIDRLAEYIDGLLDRRAAAPAEDLASDLLRSDAEATPEQRLSRQEMIALVFLLFKPASHRPPSSSPTPSSPSSTTRTRRPGCAPTPACCRAPCRSCSGTSPPCTSAPPSTPPRTWSSAASRSAAARASPADCSPPTATPAPSPSPADWTWAANRPAAPATSRTGTAPTAASARPSPTSRPRCSSRSSGCAATASRSPAAATPSSGWASPGTALIRWGCRSGSE